jgi:hypothetical protein
MVDLSDASAKVVQHPAPPEFNRETAINSWKNLNHQQDIVIKRLKPISIPLFASSSSTAAYSMIPYTNMKSVLTNTDKDNHEKSTC